MPTPAKSDLKIVDNNQEAMNVIMEAAKQAAPMVQRLASHRDRVDLAIKELESERFEFSLDEIICVVRMKRWKAALQCTWKTSKPR